MPGENKPVDLTPIDMECMRCGQTAPMRFYGICTECRAQLHDLFDREARTIEVAEYEPKMNVTPNAVALKGD
ncbi:MAG: hypothetical protein WD271_08610 [Acidimicrobiia bacterium]